MGIRTGKAFLASLRDERHIHIDGPRGVVNAELHRIRPFPLGQAEDSFGYEQKQVPNSSCRRHSVQLTATAAYGRLC